MMHKHLISLAILAMFAAACDLVTSAPAELDARSTLAPTDAAELAHMGPVIHQVIVGGSDSCGAAGLGPGCDANFSLHAIQYADGSVKGEWQDVWQLNQRASIHIKIDCLSIDGNKAWVSGVVTHPAWYAGIEAITAVQDDPDQIGLTMPAAGFTCHDQPDIATDAVDNGTVIVR